MSKKRVYETRRSGQQKYSDEMSKQGRDIGEIPEVTDSGRREKAMASLRVFCETYFPGRFYNDWSADHLEVTDQIERSVLNGELFALAMPRGSGKTSIIECAVLWVVFRGTHRYVAIVAATKGKAVDIIESLKTELQSNELLLADFPEVCYPIWKLEGITQRANGQTVGGKRTKIKWLANKLVLPSVEGSQSSGSIIHAAGLTGADIRGVKHNTEVDGRNCILRPTFALIDDPQTDKTARSLTQNETRERLVAGAVLGMAGPNRKIAAFILMTVIVPGDMADRMLNREIHPEWHGRRYKLLKKLPTNAKLWDDYRDLVVRGQNAGTGTAAATEFYVEHRAEMDEGGEAAWEARKFDDEISAIQHAMNLKIRDERAFWAEYQNEPQSESISASVIPKPRAVVERINGHPRGEVPQDTAKITAAIDVGKHLLFWVVTAWERDFSGSIIDYGVVPEQRQVIFSANGVNRTLGRAFPGSGEDGAIFAGLDELVGMLMTRKWQVTSGGIMQIERMCVDGGYKPQIVTKVRHKSGGAAMIMTKGVGIRAGSKPISQYRRKPGERIGDDWYQPSVAGTRELPHVLIDTNVWKTRLITALNTRAGDPGALTLFGKNPLDHTLFAQHLVSSESYQETQGQGRTVYEWKPLPGKPDNHWLDCMVYCMAAASIEGIRFAIENKRSANQSSNSGTAQPVRRRQTVRYL